MQARLEMLRRWSTQLDSVFEIPGLGIRFGWDPILGLLPGLGDMVTPLYSIAIVVTGMQLGIPRVVQLRMLLNVVIDAVIGAVPLVGDAFDVAWKANDWNMRLLERHAWEERPPSRGDWLFVIAIALAMLAVDCDTDRHAVVPAAVGGARTCLTRQDHAAPVPPVTGERGRRARAAAAVAPRRVRAGAARPVAAGRADGRGVCLHQRAVLPRAN